MSKFDYFVVFAEMRTGSNFLEANINSFDGLICHGEAFNPHFIGYPNSYNILGVTQHEREQNPKLLLDAIRQRSEGLGGFRFFNDHDPRVLDEMLNDPRCAKIVLTRNPIDSYVSWKIAQATGQWKLTNPTQARSEKIVFHDGEFVAHLEALQAFQVRIMNALQISGQTAFYVAYEDLQNVEVMNGLAAFLGADARIEALDKKLKKQNPEPLSEKVQNFEEMERSLARLDRFNLNLTPNFEPRRGAVIPTYIAAEKAPLLYLPIKGGPVEAVRNWLAALDGATTDQLQSDFNQKTLRQWKRKHTEHRSFAVLRHPVARAHAAFCDHIRGDAETTYRELRATLIRVFNLPLPEEGIGGGFSLDDHKAAFKAFLAFLKSNVAGQTSLRVDAAWASQSNIIQGFSWFGSPDLILREDRLPMDLAFLAMQIGRDDAPDFDPQSADAHHALLASIYDDEIEAMSRDAYQRDYMTFGFGKWKP